jgi:undecaprenyl-diphosphatase
MNVFEALLLGIIQGLTEFIPVSSTAHLLIAQNFLGIPADDTAFAFAVLVQLGTLVALAAFYWKDFMEIISGVMRGILNRDAAREPGSRLGWYILLASIPALGAGYLLRDTVEALFREPLLEAGIRLLLTTLLLTAAEYFGRERRTLTDMKWLDALVIGLFQILSVFPGSSRSGSTIAGGMLRHLDRPAAARFAFLLSAPVMLVAGGYQTLQVLELPGLGEFIPLIAVGFAAAAVVGWLAIKWLVDYLKDHSLYVFAAYTTIAGLLCLILHFMI